MEAAQYALSKLWWNVRALHPCRKNAPDGHGQVEDALRHATRAHPEERLGGATPGDVRDTVVMEAWCKRWSPLLGTGVPTLGFGYLPGIPTRGVSWNGDAICSEPILCIRGQEPQPLAHGPRPGSRLHHTLPPLPPATSEGGPVRPATQGAEACQPGHVLHEEAPAEDGSDPSPLPVTHRGLVGAGAYFLALASGLPWAPVRVRPFRV